MCVIIALSWMENVMSNEILINESSLSRILSHVNNERDFAILTAYRGIYSHNENKIRNSVLAADIKKLGYGFFHLDGFYIENMNTSDERHVKEDSLFVISNGDPAFQKHIQEFSENTIRRLGFLKLMAESIRWIQFPKKEMISGAIIRAKLGNSIQG